MNIIANHGNHGIVSDTKVVTNLNTATADLTTIANRCLPPAPVAGVAAPVGGEYLINNNNNIHDVCHILGRIVEHPNVDPVLKDRIHQTLLAGLQAGLPPTVLPLFNLGRLPSQDQEQLVEHVVSLRPQVRRAASSTMDLNARTKVGNSIFKNFIK